MNLLVPDAIKHDLDVLVIKWTFANQHLIQDHSQTPPINFFAVTLTSHYLWGEILRSADEAVSKVTSTFELGQTKVSESYMPFLIQ